MTAPNTSEATMTGHPAESAAVSAAAATAAPTTTQTAATAQAAPATQQPIYVGGHKFDTQEAALKFASDLANQNAVLESRFRAAESVVTPPNDPDKQIAEAFFEDPAAAIKMIREQAKTEVLSEVSRRTEQKSALDMFYEKNQDLKGFEDVVDVARSRMGDKLGKMSLEQAITELGTAARGRLSEIRNQPTGGRTLPEGAAVTAGAGGGPGVGVVMTAAPKSMIEQLQELKAKRTKQSV